MMIEAPSIGSILSPSAIRIAGQLKQVLPESPTAVTASHINRFFALLMSSQLLLVRLINRKELSRPDLTEFH